MPQAANALYQIEVLILDTSMICIHAQIYWLDLSNTRVSSLNVGFLCFLIINCFDLFYSISQRKKGGKKTSMTSKSV